MRVQFRWGDRIAVVFLLVAAAAWANGDVAPNPRSSPGLTLLSDRVASEIPFDPELGELQRLSPSGRYGEFTYDVATGTTTQTRVRLLELRSGRTVLEMWSPCALVFLDRDRVLAWQPPTDHPAGLRILNLRSGDEYSVPLRGHRNWEEEFGLGSLHWNPRTGEVIADGYDRGPIVYAVRVTDGRTRVLLRGKQSARFSPEGKLLAYETTRDFGGNEISQPFVWVAAADGSRAHKYLKGELMDWLPGGDLLISRTAAEGKVVGQTLFRLDLPSGRLQPLLPLTERRAVRLSPSGRWLARVNDRGRIEFFDTTAGRRVEAPFTGVSALHWGPTDEELVYAQGQAWRRARFHLRAVGPPATIPPHDLAAVEFGPESPLQPRSLEKSAVSRAAGQRTHPRITAVAAVGEEVWVGTEQGLRVLDRRNRARPLQDWQRAFDGWSIDAMHLAGDTAWLGISTGKPEDRKAASLAKIDLRTGRRSFLAGAPPPGPSFEWHSYQTLGHLYALPRGGGIAQVPGYLLQWREQPAITRLVKVSNGVDARPRALLPSPDGSFWFDTGDGVRNWRPGAPSGRAWTERQGLASNQVTCLGLTADRLWIGTLAGLSTLDLGSERITMQAAPPALGDQPVRAIETPGGAVYVATDTHLARYETASGRWTTWKLPRTRPARFFSDGRRLLATFGNGDRLLAFDGRGGWKEVFQL